MSDSEIERLKAELQKAQAHIAELEARLAFVGAGDDTSHWLYATLDKAEVGIWQWDVKTNAVLWNDTILRIFGVTRETWDGTFEAMLERMPEEEHPRLHAHIEASFSTGQPYVIDNLRVRRPSGEIRAIMAHGVPFFEEGKPVRLAGTVLDVTERKREEEERLAMQQRVIDAQREALRELGAPIIPLAEGTLAMPLVGTLTRERADQVLGTLLVTVGERHAQVVILDITGVPHIDTSIAQALVSAARSVRLLGAEVILTGIRPPVAQALVALGVDMQTFVTRADLQSGIEYAARTRESGAR